MSDNVSISEQNNCLDLPKKILTREVKSERIGEILKSIDLENFEKADTKYRKPSYQRMMSKSVEWQVKLIESILEGNTIGSLTVSRWFETEKKGDYFMIEDGQCRVSAMLNFKEGKISTKYGNYEDMDIKYEFDYTYLSLEILDKENSDISDNDYLMALCNNFQLLQEGSPLTASDRFWAQTKSDDMNYPGSPLVNLTVEMINNSSLSAYFRNYCGYLMLNSRTPNGRKKLADAVGMIAAALYGVEYANSIFFNKVPLLKKKINDEEQTNMKKKFKIIFDILKEVETNVPRRSKERFMANFSTLQKFIGSMLLDIEQNPNPQHEGEIKERWVKVINVMRNMSFDTSKNMTECLDECVYSNLTTGNRRNCNRGDYEARLDAIKVWCNRNEEV
tara:strand:- start:1632 stop:2804 length:1173 start_codon:yes stop_codon:yes gene_type:complete